MSDQVPEDRQTNGNPADFSAEDQKKGFRRDAALPGDRERPHSVPLSFRVRTIYEGKENKPGIITDNFTLIKVNDPDGQTLRSALVTDLDLLTQIHQRGVLTFDDAYRDKRKVNYREVGEDHYKNKLGFMTTITLDEKGDITETSHSILDVETPDIDPEVTLIETDQVPPDLTYRFSMAFNGLNLYDQLPPLRESYEKLGFEVESGHTKVPVPSVLVKRLEKQRQEDTSGIYYPEVKLIESVTEKGEEMPSPDFVKAYAEGKFPLGVATLLDYSHDLGDEHLEVLMVHGELLMDIMSKFASGVESLESINLPGEDRSERINLANKDKSYRGGHILDRLGPQLDAIGLQTLDENDDDELTNNLEMAFDDIVDVLRQTGTLGEVGIVQTILNTGQITGQYGPNGETVTQSIINPEQITGRMIANTLIQTTWERFAKSA